MTEDEWYSSKYTWKKKQQKCKVTFDTETKASVTSQANKSAKFHFQNQGQTNVLDSVIAEETPQRQTIDEIHLKENEITQGE